MNVLEMHIGLDILCQKLNSNVYRSLLPEEKDIILNKAQMRYLRMVTNPNSNQHKEGFEANTGRYDEIERLLTPIVLPSFEYTKNRSLNTAVFSILPSDYFRVTRIESLVIDLCGKDYVENTTLTNTTLTYSAIPLTNTSALFTAFKIKLTIDGTEKTIFDKANYTSITTLSENEQKFIYINYVLQVVKDYFRTNNPTYDIFWETWNGIYIPNNFIIVGDNLITLPKYTINETETTATVNTKVEKKVSNTAFATAGNSNPHRLTASDIIKDLLKTRFGTTIPTSPLSEIENNLLISYHERKFIIGDILMQYIRKPRLIDISLNTNCELNVNVHDKIVDLASRMIANYLNMGTQKQVMMEAMLNE